MSFSPKKILVTGSAGFIGCNFVRLLLNQYSNIFIVSLDQLTYAGSINNLNNLTNQHCHHFIQGDICDAPLVHKIIQEHNIDTIVHFAAESHVDRSIEKPATFIQTNLVGTFTLLEAARHNWLQEKKWGNDQCRFHHISTDEVYGSLLKEDNPFTEKTAYAPHSPYSASKASSDHFVKAYYHTYGLPVTMTNCSNNYGPYQHSEKLIPTIIQSCLAKKPIPVYGDGTNIRDWIYVEDHCISIDKVIRNGRLGESYNVGGNHEESNINLIRFICRQLDKIKPAKQNYESLITFIKDRAGHDWRYAIDNHKIKTELNWTPNYNFEQGLEKTINFYLTHILTNI